MEKLTNKENDKPRVVLLYRASTKKQTDSQNDIPLQRNILRPWADEQGKFIREFVEGGISGYKVSAAKRDAIVEIKAMADRREFDILGIFMSDRLGRIADDTPLIVSYLNLRGVKVISFCEGEISAKTHTDKLLTYIRYWQAEAESIKNSERITHAIEDCKFDSGVLSIACNALYVLDNIGMPEGNLALTQAIIAVCEAPKDNRVAVAMGMAIDDARNHPDDNIPDYLKNHTEASKNYKYPHDYPGGVVEQQYLPDSLKDRCYFKKK